MRVCSDELLIARSSQNVNTRRTHTKTHETPALCASACSAHIPGDCTRPASAWSHCVHKCVVGFADGFCLLRDAQNAPPNTSEWNRGSVFVRWLLPAKIRNKTGTHTHSHTKNGYYHQLCNICRRIVPIDIIVYVWWSYTMRVRYYSSNEITTISVCARWWTRDAPRLLNICEYARWLIE